MDPMGLVLLQSLPSFSLLVLGGDDGSPSQNSSLRCLFELLGISIPKIRDLFKGSHLQKPPFLLFVYKDLPFFTTIWGTMFFPATKQANLRFRLIFLFVLGDHCEPDNNNHQHCAPGKEELCNPWKMSWHVPRGQSLSLKKRQMADYIVVWGILNTNSILLMVVTKIKWYSKTITGWWFQIFFTFTPKIG